MAILLGGALGTLAAMGIIRALMLYLLKKIGRPDSWKTANFATAVVRSLLALPQLWGGEYVLLQLAIILCIYTVEQLVWFLYDYIQVRRDQKPAGWGLIFGIVCGGVLWLVLIKFLTYYISQAIIS